MNKTKRIVWVVSSAVAVIAIGLTVWSVFSRNGGVLPYSQSSANPSLTMEGQANSSSPLASTTPPVKQFYYVQIQNACDHTGVGECVNMRAGAGSQFPVVARLRNGVVLKVAGNVEAEGLTWHKVVFGTELRYKERVKGDLYIAETESVKVITNIGDQYAKSVNASSTKRIVIDIDDQTLSAYDGDTLFMQEPISTGLEFTPTPHGTFYIFKKTPSRYMQGPIPEVSDQYYDLPGVPWDLYFTQDGAVIHGAYWHDQFGKPWSHGCVNLSPENAEKLYYWADIGTAVIVQN